MTTPHDSGGDEGSDAAPFLPQSQPIATGAGEAPYIPAPAPPAPAPAAEPPFIPAPAPPAPAPAAEPPAFDAKAMVESQKHYNANPAYGALPASTEAGREAAQQLRAQAARKRKRNKRLGQVVVVLLVGAVGAAGWFGYQAYQDQQEQDALEAEARAEADEAAGAGGAAAALTPLGQQQQINEAQSDLNDVARSSSGGLLGAVEQAREVVGSASGDPAAAESADPVASPDAPAVEFVYRRWVNASPTSPMFEYFYSYDLVTDTYAGDVLAPDRTKTIIGVNDEWWFATRPATEAGRPVVIAERAPRSAASLDPAPDIPLARVLFQTDLVPPAAMPFAELFEDQHVSGERVIGYTIDTEAWRTADPATFLAWVQLWHPEGTDRDELRIADQREVGSEPIESDVLVDAEGWSSDPYVTERKHPGAAVTMLLSSAEGGHIKHAWIVDNTADFRTMYAFLYAGEGGSSMDLGDQDWVPAP